MEGFLAEILQFPTVLYTIGVAVACIYWTLVALGGADMDALDVGGGADAALDGVADGALEGAVKGATEGAVEGGLAGVLSALRLRQVPVTITLTAFTTWGFILSYFGVQLLSPLLGVGLLTTLSVAGGSFVGAVALTSLSVRPLGRLFETHAAPSKHHLIGHVCTIATGRVDARFGQASCEDGGAGLILSVRYDGDTPMVRGQEALIVDYDPARDVFVVEPLALEHQSASR